MEMPTGTGKTVSLLALIIAYLAQKQESIKKLIYCTRTVVEMEKTLREVKFVMDARERHKAKSNVKFLGVGLSARRNLCIHPEIQGIKDNYKVDAECRKRTADWVRADRARGQEVELCSFYEDFQNDGAWLKKVEEGIYSLDDLRK